MFRKVILGLSAALILGAAVAPSAALAHGNGNGHHKHHKKWHKWDKWSGGYGGYGGGYGGCWTKAKVWSDYYGEYVWKKVNICY